MKKLIAAIIALGAIASVAASARAQQPLKAAKGERRPLP